jgi:hypothetical protein
MYKVLSAISCRVVVYAVLLGAYSSGLRGQGFPGYSPPIPPNLRLAGESIPVPPQQAAAWQAPDTRLSKKFISATTELFQRGLADPRGCEYREIEVVVGASLPALGDAIVKTHGWVLPDTKNPAQRFGVCWNGLVYPLATLGRPADLAADVQAAAKAEKQAIGGITGWYWEQNFENECLCHPSESRSVSFESPLPIKACLLLRLGKAEWAEKLWTHWSADLRGFTLKGWEHYIGGDEADDANRSYLKDPYLVLANLWTLSLFDRAVGAHLRGDDHLALFSIERLAAIWQTLKAAAERHGFTKASPAKSENSHYRFLLDASRARRLFSDQRRRANDRLQKSAPPVQAGDYSAPEKFWPALGRQVDQCPDKSHRVALLIRQLEEVAFAQWSNEGWLLEHPMVSLLADEGEEAVEPLLICLENDDRLTRWPGRVSSYPVNVYVFAAAALERILKMHFPDIRLNDNSQDDGCESREVVARKIRSYWTRFKHLPPAERWYAILADDHAIPGQWVRAAHCIVQPSASPIGFDYFIGRWALEQRWLRGKQRFHGDVLRDKKNPSVAELMAKRVRDLLEPPPTDDVRNEPPCRDDFEAACEISACLATWDLTKAVPTWRWLTAFYRQWNDHMADQGPKYLEYMAQLILCRADLGDKNALDEYAEWVRTFKPDHILGNRDSLEGILGPLGRYPEYPSITAASEWLFNDKASPWYPLLFRDGGTPAHVCCEPVQGPLLSIPALRKRVAQLLEDQREIGHAEVVNNETITTNLSDVWTMSAVPNDPLCPPPRTSVAFRMCDACAFALSPLDGFPQCELFWPEKERSRAVAVAAAFLKQHGRRFRPSGVPVDVGGVKRPLPPRWSPVPAWTGSSSFHVRLALRLLDRPATPGDVRSGDAVFALAGQGSVRVYKLPDLPVAATWTTLKAYPFAADDLEHEWADSVPPKPKKIVRYEQDGLVWQAEEQLAGGRWQRYYGFVGFHGMAKVPAEEIEFPAFSDIYQGDFKDDRVSYCITVNKDFDAGWIFPDGLKVDQRPIGMGDRSTFVWDDKSPLVLKMRVRNHCGTDRTLPPLVRACNGPAPQGAIPVEIRLHYCEPFSFALLEKTSWTPVTPKKPSRLVLRQPAGTIRPTEEIDLLQCDVSGQFDITRPGIYCVSVEFGNQKENAFKKRYWENVTFRVPRP